MKKRLAMLLALVMLVMSLPFAAAEDAAPKLGDVVHGFEVKEVTTFPLINADVTYFVHQKTGAELLYLANDDTNRLFDLTFKTPAESDMGVPHVFEHATLSGSEKYPSKELFFNLSYQTYNTYMNAATYSHMTTYPVASLSEAQLLKYADFYTDSCLHPMLHEDESIFTTEAWRYALDSADSDLTIAGTVYTEMQGSYTIDSAAYQYYMDTMYPGSYASNASGGVPSEIPDMNWQDVKDYHTNYYHPSNSIAFLYGSFDNYEAFLELLDGYYAAYEQKDIVIADAGYTPITEAQTVTFQYPMEEGSNTAKAARVYYGFRLDQLDPADSYSIDLLCTLLGADAFPVMQRLKEVLPAASAGCAIVDDAPVPSIVFFADGLDEAEVPLFCETVNAALAEIAASGFDKSAVDAVVAAFNMDIKLMPESATLGIDMVPNIAYYWASTGDWHDYLNYIAAIDLFTQLNEDGTFVSLLNKYLVQNEMTVTAVTVPAPGLKEQQDAALAAELAEIKAGMTADEIAAIVENTAALAAGSTGSAAEYINQLQVVTVDSLPEEVRVYDYTDVTADDGIRRIDVAANVDGVGQAMILLNVSDMPQQYLHWFQLYTDLLCEVDTTQHTRAELAALATRYLYNGVIKVSMPFENQSDLYLRAAWIAADDDMQASYDFVRELLFDSQFTDAQRVLEYVSARKNELKNALTQEIYSYQLNRAIGIGSPSARLYDYMTSLEYYLFLEETEAKLTENPAAALAALQGVQMLVNNQSGAISAFAGSEESAANHRAIADAFLTGLNARRTFPAKYDIPAPTRTEGIVVDSSVQYNLIFATWEEIGLPEYSGDLDAVTALVADTFLIPLLRDQYGAYSVFHGASKEGMYLLTYRDPNVQESYDVYAQLPELLKDFAIDQETLNGYILSSYAYYAQSAGELAGAENAIFNIIDGKPQDELLQYMKQMKTLKAEDIAKYVPAYENLVANGVRSTAGGAGALETYADLFETVINPFNATDPAELEFVDVPEGHPLYEYVRFVYENGVMASAEDEISFGVDDPLTVGDFAVSCYLLLGGDYNPEDAVDFLKQNGLLDRTYMVDRPMTRAELLANMANFILAVGYTVEEGELGAFDDIADIPAGMEDLFAWAITHGYMLPATETTLAPAAPATRGDLAVIMTTFTSGLPMA